MSLQPINILMADDDVDDQILVKDAFEQARVTNNLTFVNDGVELMQYLRREGVFAEAARPDIVLLDLNMPRKGGREALGEIKADPVLNRIPVVILTTSDVEEDVLRSYHLGANSYIQKPVTFGRMVEMVAALGEYWIGVVRLPQN